MVMTVTFSMIIEQTPGNGFQWHQDPRDTDIGSVIFCHVVYLGTNVPWEFETRWEFEMVDFLHSHKDFLPQFFLG